MSTKATSTGLTGLSQQGKSHPDKSKTAKARLESATAGSCLFTDGHWVLHNYESLANQLAGVESPDHIDFSGLEQLDTAGATLLTQCVGAEKLKQMINSTQALSKERIALLLAVAEAVGNNKPEPETSKTWITQLDNFGKQVINGWYNIRLLIGFMGMALGCLAATLPHPKRWRYTELVNQVHKTGLNAVPIVALLTFLVGAVVAFLGATVLSEFGASIYTVNLVAYSFLREFGVLLTAILLAGRTASAFTAELGSMKVNEEIDALHTLGLSTLEILVLPRVLAMLITLPLLTFVAMLSGLLGGLAVSIYSLDISLTRYLSIIEEVPLRHFLVGMGKAPFFAFLIALIGCLEGFKVSGSARSVGEHTTSSVVQSIFAVILLDAVAAMFFMEMNW